MVNNNSRLKRIEKEEPEDIGIMENQIFTVFDRILRCLYGNILPVFIIVLIINLTIMFTLPVEKAMSGWFWLKDALYIILAIILAKTIKY